MDREELLRSARNLYENPGTNEALKVVLEETYPELKESDDERIRKAIEGTIRVYGKTQGEWLCGYDMDTLVVHLREAFGALKMQKEQKPALRITKGFYEPDGPQFDIVEQQPAEWSEEDERNLSTIVGLINVHYRDYDIVRDEYPINAHNLIDWLNSLPERFSLRPKQEWSEEDEEMLDAMVDIVANSLYEPLCPRDKMLCWLKSLRPQPHWKPSEKEIEALSWAINYLTDIEQGCASTLALLKFNLKEML